MIQSGWFGQGWRSVYMVGGLAPILAAFMPLGFLSGLAVLLVARWSGREAVSSRA